MQINKGNRRLSVPFFEGYRNPPLLDRNNEIAVCFLKKFNSKLIIDIGLWMIEFALVLAMEY
jgi:hypothetical protein